MTTLQAVCVCATYMQMRFNSGTKYGAIGCPNMQSILELANLSDDAATAAIASEPYLADIAREAGLL